MFLQMKLNTQCYIVLNGCHYFLTMTQQRDNHWLQWLAKKEDGVGKIANSTFSGIFHAHWNTKCQNCTFFSPCNVVFHFVPDTKLWKFSYINTIWICMCAMHVLSTCKNACLYVRERETERRRKRGGSGTDQHSDV